MRMGRPAGTTIFPPAFNWWISGGNEVRALSRSTLEGVLGPATIAIGNLRLMLVQPCRWSAASLSSELAMISMLCTFEPAARLRSDSRDRCRSREQCRRDIVNLSSARQ